MKYIRNINLSAHRDARAHGARSSHQTEKDHRGSSPCAVGTTHTQDKTAAEGVIMASGVQVRVWEQSKFKRAQGMCQVNQLEARTSKM